MAEIRASSPAAVASWRPCVPCSGRRGPTFVQPQATHFALLVRPRLGPLARPPRARRRLVSSSLPLHARCGLCANRSSRSGIARHRRGEGSSRAALYTAEKQPAVFFATCARLLPNDVRVTVEQQLPGNLSPVDWNLMLEIVDAVKQTIPDASNRPPGAVLEHVLDALRQAETRTLKSSESSQKTNSSICSGEIRE
jgi:hypothetical protein